MAKIKKTYLAPSVAEDVEQLERSCIAGEMVQPLWEIIWQILIKPNVHLNYDPKILLLHIQRCTYVHVEMCPKTCMLMLLIA